MTSRNETKTEIAASRAWLAAEYRQMSMRLRTAQEKAKELEELLCLERARRCPLCRLLSRQIARLDPPEGAKGAAPLPHVGHPAAARILDAPQA